MKANCLVISTRKSVRIDCDISRILVLTSMKNSKTTVFVHAGTKSISTVLVLEKL